MGMLAGAEKISIRMERAMARPLEDMVAQEAWAWIVLFRRDLGRVVTDIGRRVSILSRRFRTIIDL
jgi:hypothetical protein